MQTIFDWLSLIVFSGLAVLFLQRSVEGEALGRMWLYLPPAICCAAANWLGNNGFGVPGSIALVVAVAYIVHVLKPVPFRR